MDRYERVENPKKPSEPIAENEVRITTQGKMKNYITYGISLFQDKDKKVVLVKGMGRAISKAVTIAEILKRRVAGLHQLTELGSVNMVDTWEPLEEGLKTVETTRHVSMITITLSLAPLDTSQVGYQAPIDARMVKPFAPSDTQGGADPRAGESGGKGKGKRQGPKAPAPAPTADPASAEVAAAEAPAVRPTPPEASGSGGAGGEAGSAPAESSAGGRAAEGGAEGSAAPAAGGGGGGRGRGRGGRHHDESIKGPLRPLGPRAGRAGAAS